MRPDLKMSAVAAIAAAIVLAFAGLATAFAATNQIKVQSDTTNTTSTTTTTTSTVTKKVFRSQYCKARINQHNPATWACTTITVDPFVVEAGDKFTVTDAYRAKIRLRYVRACFSGMENSRNIRCLYQHKFRRLRRGRVIRRTFSLKAPTDGRYGVQRLDNFTWFYKGQKWADPKYPYWPANAAVCITTVSHPDACS
jgi:hypothetical protein